MSNKNSKISDIAKFLIKNEKVCLVIRGAWGVGKTCLWREVEKEIKEKNKEKQVVYIDLFGKESYKQILEEIVLKVNEICNERVKKICDKAKPLFQSLKGVTLGVMGVNAEINIDVSSIFSIFKKEDFKNIIVCFDNIERKSDKLPLDEILGLISLLKEDKFCNVVMIFDKDELDKRESNNQKEQKANSEQESSSGEAENSKTWYETYKEKVIDYEIPIENNDETARKIIEENLKWDTKEIKQEIVNLIFECFKQGFKFNNNNNLRLLIKLTQHIDYFNEHCFFKAQKEKPKEMFLKVLKLYYERMVLDIGEYYFLIPKDNLPKFPFGFNFYENFLNSLLELDEDCKTSAQRFFLKELDKESVTSLREIQENYTNGNLSDNQYAEWIKNIFQNTEKSFLVDDLTNGYDRYQILFKLCERIKKEELPQEYEIKEQYIISHTKKDNDSLNSTLKAIINEGEKYKQIYDECRNQHKTTDLDIKSFINRFDLKDKDFGRGIAVTFSPKDIVKYNNFPVNEIANVRQINEIVKVFQNNNEFCKIFSEYFSDKFSSDFVKEYNLENRLFQAYEEFLNKEEYKVKKEMIKERLEEKRTKEILNKEYKKYTENQNQDSPYKKFFEYFEEYMNRNNIPRVQSIIKDSLPQAYKEFCGKDENKEEKEKMEENLKKNPLTSIILKLINEEE
ncbi:P-loop NTPase fold protein [Helicobacter rodentium]|uniref:P-loop NTPase fold protein n=1 Tax=Helicobacter rodentium TaxID=59617 RepID=UPI00047E0C50|nr:P-loop NTPase fold protein [Helicobacter rodentium]